MTPCTLRKDHVDLYAIEWPNLSDACFEKLVSLLTDDDLDRLAKLRQSKDQKRFQVARGALRAISSIYLPNAGALTLGYSEKGKPFWADHNDLQFNLSHSGDWILLGFSNTQPIGVDIQDMRPLKNIKGNAAIAFHPAEQLLFETATDTADDTDTYYQIWSLREAGLKSVGAGLFALREEYNTLPLPCKDWQERAFTGENSAITQMTKQLDIAPNYTSAIAVLGRIAPSLNIAMTDEFQQIICP